MWQKGPLPLNTWHWGGIVLKGESGIGFHFADFHGDHATLVPGDRKVQADEVEWYNNALVLPIPGKNDVKGRIAD